MFLFLQANTLKTSGDVKIITIGVNGNISDEFERQMTLISDQLFTSKDYLDGLHNGLYADVAKAICIEAS